jgi:ribonuclease VapC
VATDFELVLSAAKLKAEFPVSYADCFAIATAMRHQAAVVTGDPEFKRFEHCVAIQWV